MPISNPATQWVSGQKTKSFTYESNGANLWHFSPRDNGLSRTMECNVIFVAGTEAEAMEILRRMFEFNIDCNNEYLENSMGIAPGAHTEEFKEKATSRNETMVRYLNAMDEGKIKLHLAPTNQFYEVGWAANDRLF